MTDFKIKPEMKEAWIKDAGQNCCDGYSFGVVTAVVGSFAVLDRNGSAEEAEKVWSDMGISGFMAGCAASMIAKYHERGDEFRKWWNTKYGVDEEKAQGGTVNPAIFTART